MPNTDFEKALARKAKAKRRANPESAIQRAIMETLGYHGLLVVRIPGQGVLRNAGTEKARITRSPMSGYPDLLVLGPDGRSAWLEVKTCTGKLSPLQRERIEALGRLGHTAAVVRSPEQALAVLREAGWF